jgi:hypothetical protein
MQGSIISPKLFNIYLDEAIMANQTLKVAVKRGDLKAFTDDL